jgi:hypothetical protein
MWQIEQKEAPERFGICWTNGGARVRLGRTRRSLRPGSTGSWRKRLEAPALPPPKNRSPVRWMVYKHCKTTNISKITKQTRFGHLIEDLNGIEQEGQRKQQLGTLPCSKRNENVGKAQAQGWRRRREIPTAKTAATEATSAQNTSGANTPRRCRQQTTPAVTQGGSVDTGGRGRRRGAGIAGGVRRGGAEQERQ